MFGLPPLPRTVEACFRDLESRNDDTRRGAIRDLVRVAQGSDDVRSRALPKLTHVLANDREPSVRAEAATALADLRAKECLPQLLVAMEDEHGIVGQMALAALGEVEDPRALPRLERAARDERPAMRYQAAIARARMLSGDPLIDALAAALADEDPNVRYIALRLLEERVGRKEIRIALADRAHPLSVRVHKALDGEAPVATAAALVLARCGDRSVVPTLLRVATREVRVAKEDEEAVYEILGALGVAEARRLLERRAFGLRSYFEEGIALAARVGLARLGDERARAIIKEDLASPRVAARTRGAVAAGRAKLRHLREEIERAGLEPRLLEEVLAELDREDDP